MPFQVQLNAAKLREHCDALGWSVADFAAVAERDQTTIYRALRGGCVGAETIAACAALFGEDALADLLVISHSSGRPIAPPVRPRRFAPLLARDIA